jgi:hypothetical protein
MPKRTPPTIPLDLISPNGAHASIALINHFFSHCSVLRETTAPALCISSARIWTSGWKNEPHPVVPTTRPGRLPAPTLQTIGIVKDQPSATQTFPKFWLPVTRRRMMPRARVLPRRRKPARSPAEKIAPSRHAQ